MRDICGPIILKPATFLEYYDFWVVLKYKLVYCLFPLQRDAHKILPELTSKICFNNFQHLRNCSDKKSLDDSQGY